MPYLKPATDAPFGFAPADGNTARINQYSKSASTAAFFAGDVLLLNSSGQVQAAAAITDRAIVGVAVESVATSATSALVYDDPNQLFVCQEDSVGTALAQTHMGNQASITGFAPTTAAQILRGRSIAQLDTSTLVAGTEGTLNQCLQLLRMSGIEGGSFPSAAGSPRKVIVKFNPYYHAFASASGV